MKVELKHIDALKPYENNPRDNDPAVEGVVRSIREFGWRVPVVIDENNIVICGHTRLKAARTIGIDQIPVHVARGLTPAQVRGLRIADNATSAIAKWDEELLPLELQGLQEMGFDLSALGFDEDALTRWLKGDVVEGLTDSDEAPDPPTDPISQPGDLWLLGDHRVLCGDSTKSEDVARLLNCQTAAMCFTDPPWNVAIGLDSNPRHRQRKGLANDSMGAEQFESFLSGFIDAMRPHLQGDLYCVLGGSEMLTLDRLLRGRGFHWSATIVWVKDTFVLGRSNYHRRNEPIWYGWHETGKSSFNGARDQDDVWECARPRRSDEHPTMKPVALVAKAIANSSGINDIVYEPFGGSGSTLIAAHSLNRRCYAMELDPGYVDVIVRRWEAFTGKKAERAPTATDQREKAPAKAEAKKRGKK